jgi:hypothetical protein
MALPEKRILRTLEDAEVVAMSESRLAGAEGVNRKGADHVHKEIPTVDDERVDKSLSESEQIPEEVNDHGSDLLSLKTVTTKIRYVSGSQVDIY